VVLNITHEYWMNLALSEARNAFDDGEVPVGAVVVKAGVLLGKGCNRTKSLADPTAHAEIIAITAACQTLKSERLDDCDIYSTLEPCPMCAGASFWVQLGKIVYGAKDEKRGYSVLSDKIIHPKTKIISGVLAEECGELMKEFFRKKR